MTEVQQVGGDHYKGLIQHWDVIDNADVDYLPATGTKYIDRWRHKGTPLLDLEKARTYFVKMNGRGVRRHADMEDLSDWLRARNHEDEDAELLVAALSPEHGTPADIRFIIDQLEVMILQQKAREIVTA